LRIQKEEAVRIRSTLSWEIRLYSDALSIDRKLRKHKARIGEAL
jgi:hypothetical protein